MKKYSVQKKTVRALASGDSLSIRAYTFPGTKKNAPSAYLQSAVHGSEVQGSLVLAKLIEHFTKHPPLGTVRIVPNANPVGLNEKRGEYTDGRFDPSTGDNWNRMYFNPTTHLDWDAFLEKYEGEPEQKLHSYFRKVLKKGLQLQSKKPLPYSERLALSLQQLSIDFDHVLDLHCANRSVRYCYVPQFARKDAEYFGIPFHIMMPNRFSGSMDEVSFYPWVSLADKADVSIPVQSFTLELGNHEDISTKGAQQDLANILSYLSHRGVVKEKKRSQKPVRCEQADYKIIFAPTGGLAEILVPMGGKVKKGQLLARILRFEDRPRYEEVRSPADAIVILCYSSAVVHEGAELFRIFTKYY